MLGIVGTSDLTVHLLREAAVPPRRRHVSSRTYDLAAAEDVHVPAWERRVVPLGFVLTPPAGCSARVESCPELCARTGLQALTIGPGNGKNEAAVLLGNLSSAPTTVRAGERVGLLALVRTDTPLVRLM